GNVVERSTEMSTAGHVRTVSFNANGHGSDLDARRVISGNAVTRPEDPTAAGFTFMGWYRDKSCTEVYDFGSEVNEDITLYAKWEPVYTVSFNANGHGSAPASQTVFSGNAVTRPEDPTAAGYTFMGWYRDKSCKEVYDFSAGVNEDITLYAKWEAKKTEVSTREEIISRNSVSVDKVILMSDCEVTYPSLLPYSFNKGKSKDFYRIFGMTVSSNGTEYAVTKGKVVVIKIKDGDGTYTLDHYLQITGLTPMEKGEPKTSLTKDEKKAAKTLAKGLKNATKVDKKAAKTGVGKSTTGIHVTVYPYSLSNENVSDSENGLTNLVLSGKPGKYQLKYTFVMTKKTGKVKDGKMDAQKDPALVTYDKDKGIVTVSSCEIQGSIAVSSGQVIDKTKD
ncbi:MAG: InlB B-repeat-containing protein, partial [Lachnospiraceae bacterium]|nr:InlB B-repeat-containing protein [Lachnospiraceae bacterium]